MAQIHEVALAQEPGAAPACTLLEKPWRDYRKQAVGEVEKRFLEAALKRHAGNVAKVAELMDLSTRAVYLKLQAYAIDLNGYRC